MLWSSYGRTKSPNHSSLALYCGRTTVVVPRLEIKDRSDPEPKGPCRALYVASSTKSTAILNLYDFEIIVVISVFHVVRGV